MISFLFFRQIVDVPTPTQEERIKGKTRQEDQVKRFRNKAGRFHCPSCDKSFRHLTHLSRHRKVHKTDTVDDKSSVTCQICGKKFSRPDSMKRHRKVHTEDYPPLHTPQISGEVGLTSMEKLPKSCTGFKQHLEDAGNASTTCPACGAIFPRASHMLRHLENHHGGELSSCPASSNPAASSFQSDQDKIDADQIKDRNTRNTRTNSSTRRSQPSQPRETTCPMCDKVFTRSDSLNAHVKKYHKRDFMHSSLFAADNPRVDQTLQSPLPKILREDPQDYSDTEDGENNQLREAGDIVDVLREHWASVRTHYWTGRRIQDMYNFRLVGQPEIDVNDALRMIFRLRCRAKINLSFGFILRHTETGQLRYFHASQNNARLFPTPETVASEQDMERVMKRVRGTDVLQYGFQRRPDTK